jgi:electron transport complex protein RnfC
MPIRRFPFPEHLFIHMSQHLGAPAKPTVFEGQEVLRGQLIAESQGFVSVPYHSPATGKVEKITSVLNFDGKMTPAIVIAPYPASPQDVIVERDVDPDALDEKGIIAEIQKMGMVGLGGAAFPTHVKLAPPEGKTVETLILNGCECEPYLTSDHRVMLEYPDRIIAGAKLVRRALGAREVVIAIESNKPDAIERMQKAADGLDGYSVVPLKTKYPQGAEKMLTRALLNKDIPSGGLPADIGVVCSNIATVAEIGHLLPHGQGLIERVVTISGRGVKNPGNYMIPIGTPLNHVLDHVGLTVDASEVIFGGPMMGKAVAYMETPITKGVSGIVVMTQDELPKVKKVHNCIKCGECLLACPIHLNPSRLGLLAKVREFDVMADEFHLFDCFECGSCSWVCPSNIPLVQYFRLAKQMVREQKAKQ